MTQLQNALKEWSVAVKALVQGETITLLRKGGIREQAGRFSVATQSVLLYPTYEHQKTHLLKPDYARQVKAAAPGEHPNTVTLTAWADITDILKINQPEPGEQLNALLPFHIWNQTFVNERLGWKPAQPLYVLLLRVYRLPVPVELIWLPKYGGCRSWLTLEKTVQTENSVPTLSKEAYQQEVEQIYQVLKSLDLKIG